MNANHVNRNLARTKTVATAGPASQSKEMIRELILAGVDVFRLNMAHGSNEGKAPFIANVREVAGELGASIGVLVDLAGPKIRLGQIHNNEVTLVNGQQVSFVPGVESDKPDELVCLYEPLIGEVKPGDMIVLADGIARLICIEKTADRLICEVNDGGMIRSRQGVNLPATNLSVPALGEVDIENARWAASVGADFVSLSFVRNASEIESLKKILDDSHSSATVIAKIEKREALDNLDEIVSASDGIMVARGDLGVEIDIAQTPLAQKAIIDCCSRHQKPVIVATQMLESMHHCKQPTRAEVSDVANAILDGADACMLSGETAVGDYPVESVRMMNRIMVETEKTFRKIPARRIEVNNRKAELSSEVLTTSAANIAERIGARLVAIASSTSETARLKSKHRDFLPTLCITDSIESARRMSLYWGIVPVVSSSDLQPQQLRKMIELWAKDGFGLESGEEVVTVSDTELIPGVHDSIAIFKVS